MARAAFCLVAALAVCACGRTPPADSPTAAPPPAGVTGPVTFARDVAPILYGNCVTCHRPGQVAPFSLVDYEDARKRAQAIVDVTTAREMPPWPAAPGEIAFAGERRLKDEQIATLRRWHETGAPQGNPADRPRAPVFPDGWQLGTPDVVLTMPKPFDLAAGEGDRYRQIVFQAPVAVGRFVRAVEFRTGAAPIHHAVVRVDRTRSSRRRDAADKEPGFDGVMVADARNPEGHFVGWAPGRGPIVAPEGMPWRLEAGADVVVELHLVPGRAPVKVQPSIALFFTDSAPTRTPVELTMGSMSIDIPAGDPSFVVTSTFVLPVDVTLLALTPHAHYLGRSMDISAVLPGGAVKRLLRIPHWNFHWQQEYRLLSPVSLAAGTTLAMEYVFDNSEGNEHNPSSPPKRVLFGLDSTDEMANLSLQVLTSTPLDGRRLLRSMIEMQTRENVAGAELKVRVDARNPQYQWELGRSLVEAGRLADAIAPLEIAVRSDPKFARAQDFLGRALFSVRRADEALKHFRQAVALDPDDELLHLDLGKALVDMGQLKEAIASFERARTVNPEYGPAYEGLGVAFVRMGRFPEAVRAFERSVALQPDSAAALNGLAVALAQSGRLAEALEQVKRALAVDPDFAPAKDNLARMTHRRR